MFIILVLLPFQSFAFLDFMGDQAKKAVEVATVIESVGSIVDDVTPNDEIKSKNEEIQNRAHEIRRKSNQVNSLNREAEYIFKNPQFGSNRIDDNIRTTSNYVRRLKQMIMKMILLGTDGATTLNTIESNMALNEIQKNQQVLILQNEERKVFEAESTIREKDEWNRFFETQRNIRKGVSSHGEQPARLN